MKEKWKTPLRSTQYASEMECKNRNCKMCNWKLGWTNAGIASDVSRRLFPLPLPRPSFLRGFLPTLRNGLRLLSPSLPLSSHDTVSTGNESVYPLVRNYVARNTTWNIRCNVDKYRATTMWTRGIIGKSNREVTFPIGSPRVPNVWQTIVLFSLASLTRIRTRPRSGSCIIRR